MDNSKKGLPSNECRGAGPVEVTDTSPPETPMRSLEQQFLFFQARRIVEYAATRTG